MITCSVFTLSVALALTLLAVQTGATYPDSGGGYEGWTAEETVGLSGPHHVQLAHAGGYLYMVADQGSNMHFYRTDNVMALSFEYIGMLDHYSGNAARNAYIDASDKYVVVSWTEQIGGIWSLVIKCSWDHGATFPYEYVDTGAGWANYEAHVDIAGSRVHAAYVTDYSGRLEVYYKRFDMSLNLQAGSWASENAAPGGTYPCIEASDATHASVYYVHMSGPPNPIYQACTCDGGATWSRGERLPTGGGTDFTYPECTAFNEGATRRVIVVADGRNTSSNYHSVYYSRWDGSSWNPIGEKLVDCDTKCIYPQVSKKGTSNDILVTYRQSGGTLGNEGSGLFNNNSAETSAWEWIDGLFYNNMPYDNAGCIDCCSDGTRFFTAQAGTGTRNVLMVKREDTQDPNVTINDPGKYQSDSFHVNAAISDDFAHSGTWMLGPAPYNQQYNSGIVYADFEYRYNNGSWQSLYSDQSSPWDAYFDLSAKNDGEYDFRVTGYDTSGRQNTSYYGGSGTSDGVIVDRAPPTSVQLQISAPDGDNGWYISQPSVGPNVTAQDALSGVKSTYYKYDDAADWTLYSTPFALLEGEHAIHYYAQDNAGNDSPVKEFLYMADFTDPKGDIVSPSPGGYFREEMEVEATCEDGVSGVAALTWFVDGAPLYTAPEPRASLDISGLKDGQHSLELEVKDTAGRIYRSSPVLFYKDVTPPVVEVEEPSGEHWVRGMVTIKADIRDNLKVGRAEFYVDGVKVDERTSAPWIASWDTSTSKNGYHAVRVKAWDAAGNQGEVAVSGEVTVYVGNNISETNHFAEGCTRSGFDTWLCLQNPGDEPASVTVNYYLGEGQGSASARTYALPPHSRSTVYVNGDVGADKDVSIQVTSSKPIVSERPMYFDYQGTAARHWQGCHTAQGAHFPREDWFFAEGCTRDGFETWLCLQNPEGREALVKVEYMMEGGASLERTYRVPPWSRGTVLVNGEVGPDHDVSMHVSSETPIVAERPVYFLYQGMWDGGHNVMGAAQPENEWYFAEGCTRTGFNQWICLQNPNEAETSAKITYIMEDGGRIEREYYLAPRSRFTVNVNNDVARQHDVSATVSSRLPIVAERPMYFLYNSTIDEGSNAMGVCKPGSSWYLAEGCTRAGFEEWVCLMNPGDEEAEVILRFMLEDGSQREHVVSVPPGTRVTVKVNDVVGPEHDVSCEAMSDRPVIVERPMYSLYRGSCPSGDTLSGYTFNP